MKKKNITSIIQKFYYQIQFKNRLKFWKKRRIDLVDKLIASQIINSLHYISLEVLKLYFQKIKCRKVFTFKNIYNLHLITKNRFEEKISTLKNLKVLENVKFIQMFIHEQYQSIS